jgi:hypothetical protein
VVGLVAWSFAKASKSFLLAAVSAAFVAVSARFAEGVVQAWVGHKVTFLTLP